jgi:hypothetical protein
MDKGKLLKNLSIHSVRDHHQGRTGDFQLGNFVLKIVFKFRSNKLDRVLRSKNLFSALSTQNFCIRSTAGWDVGETSR